MTYIIITLGYILILAGLIFYKSRSVKTEDDFMVAGRNVPIYLLVGTLITTWIGSGSLFGTAGLTFRTGFSELWFSLGAWVGIIIVYFIAARVRKISQYTLTDILEKRYAPIARLLGTITVVLAYVMIAGYQFKGGGRFISILTDGAISVEMGTFISFIVIILFTALAGMVSIISIDIFNGILVLLRHDHHLACATSTSKAGGQKCPLPYSKLVQTTFPSQRDIPFIGISELCFLPSFCY